MTTKQQDIAEEATRLAAQALELKLIFDQRRIAALRAGKPGTAVASSHVGDLLNSAAAVLEQVASECVGGAEW